MMSAAVSCALRSFRISRHFDSASDNDAGDFIELVVVSPSAAPIVVVDNCDEQRINRQQHQRLFGAIVRYRDKVSKLCFRGHHDQYRMYLITTLLPGPSDEPLINRVLPKELLLRVFSFLDIVSLCRCAQVCRHWNVLALDGSNWQCVDLFEFQKDVKAPVVENLAKRCGGFLRRLSLRGCEGVKDGALRLFAEKCPNIEELNLEKCKHVTDMTCENLGRYCHRLLSLNLENCPAVSERGLHFISEGCRNLEYLNISWCDNVPDRGLDALAHGCPQLKSLICKGCQRLTDGAFSLISARCHELSLISLHSCVQMTDRTIEDIARGCPRLEYLSVSMCTQLTDRSLIALANGCQMLKDLEAAGCASLTDSGFAHLAKTCHELERLDLEDCSMISDQTIENLTNGCPNIVNMTLSHCELITDQGLRQLAIVCSLRDRLQVLELDNCPLISDSALDYLRQVRSLHRIELFDCQLITKEGIKRFKQFRPEVEVHAYFAPATPPPTAQPRRRGLCRCCAIL